MKIIQTTIPATIDYVTKRSASAASNPEVDAAVAKIIANVRANGDQAVRDYEKQFDNIELSDLRVPQSELDDAYAAADPQLIDALELAKRNITSYHTKEKQFGFVDAEQPGVMRGERITPLAAVGVYVPGGTAAYPSSILMNVLPAKIAGVKRIVLVTPPHHDGLNSAVLTAAKIAGVDEVYQVAGLKQLPRWLTARKPSPRSTKLLVPATSLSPPPRKWCLARSA